jgi:F-type H+-transporting ATPase subunit epsilon
MADTMQFDLVSPERMLASVAASSVQIPGAEGDYTAMPGHEPTLTTLRPGVVVAETERGEVRYVVTGGFAEITGERISILAERSLLAEELKQAEFDLMATEARTAREAATGPEQDSAYKHFADIMALGRQLGLQAASD